MVCHGLAWFVMGEWWLEGGREREREREREGEKKGKRKGKEKRGEGKWRI